MRIKHINYQIKAGDTLTSISQRLGVPLSALKNAKNLPSPDFIQQNYYITTINGEYVYQKSSGPEEKSFDILKEDKKEEDIKKTSSQEKESTTDQKGDSSGASDSEKNEDTIKEGSGNAGECCEKCNEQKLKCLVHVELKSPLRQKKYCWKGPTCGELTGSGPIIVGTMIPDKPIGKDIEFKPFEISVEVINSKCAHNYPQCTTLYHYELDYNNKVIDKIHAANEKQKELSLEFNKDYLSNEKIPAYVGTLDRNTKDDDEDPPFRKLDKVENKLSGIALKLESGDANLAFTTNIVDFITRAFYFLFLGKLEKMPASLFHISALECKDRSEITSLSESSTKEQFSSFSEAKANIFVIPHYELEYDIELFFGEGTAQDSNLRLSIEDVKQKLARSGGLKQFIIENFKLKLSLKEKFNGEEANTLEVEVSNIVEFLQKFTKLPTLGFMADLAFNLSLVGDALAAYDLYHEDQKARVKQSLKEDELFTYTGKLPNVKIKGKSALGITDNRLQIVHENSTLSADPLVGGDISVNLAVILLKAVPVLNKAYEKAKGAATFVNDLDFGATIDISTDPNFEAKLTPAQKEQRKKASVGATILIYAQLYFKGDYILDGTFKDDYLFRPTLSLTESAIDIQIGFRAGASFKAKIWIFQGALDAKLDAFTGLRIGSKTLKRKGRDGSETDISTEYLLWKGLGIAWNVKISGGLSGDNDELSGEGNASSNEYADNSTSSESKQSSEYDNVKDAQKRLDEIREKQARWVAAQNRVGPPPEPINYYTYRTEKKEYEDRVAKEAGFDFTEGYEMMILERNIKLYNEHGYALDEISRLNGQLNGYKDEYARYLALEAKYKAIAKIADPVIDHNLPLPKDSFYRSDPNDEYRERDELIGYIDDELKKLNANPEQNRDRIKELKKLREDVNALPDDNGKKKLFGPALWGANNLLSSERKNLERELIRNMNESVSDGLKDD